MKSVHAWVEEVTPDAASRYLSQYPYEHQRPLRQDIVTRYAELMTRGLWPEYTDLTLGVVGENGKQNKHLVNGQHRLHAVVLSGTSQMFRMGEMSCADYEELAKLYASFDRGKVRSAQDVLRVREVGALLGLTDAQLRVVTSAAKLIFFNLRRRSTPMADQDLVETILEYADEIEMYFSAVEGCLGEMYRHLMQVGGMVAFGMVTFKHARKVYGDKVEDFWRGVAKDAGESAFDPRRTFVRHLMTTRLMSGQIIAQQERIITVHYRIHAAARCFNAWTEGREISKIQVADQNAPYVINGTPWNGKLK